MEVTAYGSQEQRFGIEIEMTGITREKAAEVTAEYFGTRTHYVGTYYDTYAAIDNQDGSGSL